MREAGATPISEHELENSRSDTVALIKVLARRTGDPPLLHKFRGICDVLSHGGLRLISL